MKKWLFWIGQGLMGLHIVAQWAVLLGYFVLMGVCIWLIAGKLVGWLGR